MNNIKVKIYHLESKSNDKGEAPIYIRIILDGKKIQLSTGIFLKAEFWDHKKKIIKSRHPDAIRLNLQLESDRKKIISLYYDLQKSGRASLEVIKGIWNKKEVKGYTLLNLVEYNNNLIKSAIGITYALSTYKLYCSLKNKITSFINLTYSKSDLELSDLALSVITKFENYLTVEYGNSVNSIAKQMDRLKRVINLGLQNDWLNDDPFKKYKKKTVPCNRKYLSPEEVSKLQSLDLGNDSHLERVRDIFIFICYTGISYCDLALLKRDNISIGIDGSKFIRLERTKTLEVCNIPLLPVAEKILDKYSQHPISQNKGILLPVISNQKMNEYLKTIAKRAEVNKKVTCHIGRHTFATMSLEMGVPMETVSKVLGHSSIKTTQIYGKVTNTKISKDYGSFYSQKSEEQAKAV